VKIKLSKSQWEQIGKKAGWISKKSQVISDDGYADGGEPYTDDEMDLMEIEKIKANPDRPERIQQIMRLYSSMHPKASGYEFNTLWNDIGQMSMGQLDEYIEKYVRKWTRDSLQPRD